jgi:mRNA interferase ChpB
VKTAKQGEIWRVSLRPVMGKEQDSQNPRPILVLSITEHNRRFPAIVAPITGGGEMARNEGLTVPLAGLGLQTDGVVLAHQVRAVDLVARRAVFIEAAPPVLVDQVLNTLGLVLGMGANG